ncbi:MAG TPA: helix-turn-helix domain-containing protein [Blastocatellia bacterium]|nr:helix-turn-helix domain-containing protein [Blastocatellia bacterium]
MEEEVTKSTPHRVQVGVLQQAVEEIEPKLRGGKLARIWKVMKANYADQSLSWTRVAREAGACPRHMNRTLVGACGLTFKQLLIRVRLLAAVEALSREQGVLINEVALRVGFSTVAAFRIQFKSKIGLNPEDVRRK